MTAEVAVLNKTAVALAADSAMTLGDIGKIYPANKLFELTKHHPVGVMIYNNAAFMGVPWETIVKMYRERIGPANKPTCKDYAKDLLDFIAKPPFGTDEQETVNLVQMASYSFAGLRESATRELDAMRSKKVRVSVQVKGRVIRKTVEARISELLAFDECDSMNDVNAGRIVFNNRKEIDGCIERQLSGFYISQRLKRLLYRVLSLTIKSAEPSGVHSGVVIAGFGKQEIFPTLIELTVEGKIGGVLKHNFRLEADIARRGTSALIKPFAQSEMVHRFMSGVDPELHLYLLNSLGELLFQFGTGLLGAHKIANKRNLRALKVATSEQADKYFDHLEEFRHQNFVDPVMDIVNHLPKDELAGMAEALVNLTSLKRRVSRDEETVGGPIDSAVISKGDGFVWIKRKHYFDPAFNPGYFNRQLLESQGGSV